MSVFSAPEGARPRTDPALRGRLAKALGPENLTLAETASEGLRRLAGADPDLRRALRRAWRERPADGSGADAALAWIFDRSFAGRGEGASPVSAASAGTARPMPGLVRTSEGGENRAFLLSELGTRDAALEPETVEALRQAQRDDYVVETLAVTLGGRKRLVVLLGEAHYKSQDSFELGGRVVQGFKYRGIEGYDTSLTLGGRFLIKMLLPLARSLYAAKGGDTTRESTAYAATGAKPGDPELRGSLPARNGDVFYLEAGHRPGLSERVVVLLLPALIVSLLVVFPLATLLAFIPVKLLPADWARTATIAFDGLWLYVSTAAILFYLLDLFLLKHGLLTGRNRTMAANIAKAFELEPGMDRLLLIVGKEHVPGIKELLIGLHGFAEEPVLAPVRQPR